MNTFQNAVAIVRGRKVLEGNNEHRLAAIRLQL
jgi:hypothetical protein